MTDWELEHVAFHEAGHAVAAIHEGFTIVEIDIHEHGGGCHHRTPKRTIRSSMSLRAVTRLQQKLDNQHVAVMVGGAAAEKLLDPDGVLPYCELELQEAYAVCNRVDGKGARRFPKLGCRCERILRAKWSAVGAVAKRLKRDRRIAGADVHSIVSEALASSNLGG